MADIAQNRTVTSKQLKTALRYLIKTKHPAFVWGQYGIGKSDIINDLCKEMGGKVFDIRLSQCEQTDLRGMPYFDHDSKTMKWAPPIDLPSKEEAAQYPVVFLFLDELNSASPSIQAAAYQLLLDRKVGTYTLPDNCFVVAAGNREGDRGVTYRMPKPLSNRLVHFELRVDFACWHEWAIENNVHPDVVGFLNFSKVSLNDYDPKSPHHAFATPRTWVYVSDIIRDSIDSETAMNIICGTIGEGLALTFEAHRNTMGNMPNPSEILDGKVGKLATQMDVSAQYSIMTSMLYELKTTIPENTAPVEEQTKWHNRSNHMLNFIMDNFGTEIQVMGMRTGLQTMSLPFDHRKMMNFSKFFDTTGKLIMKSLKV